MSIDALRKNETTVRLQIDKDIKEKAEAVFAKLGMTLNDAINVFAKQSVEVGGMPIFVRDTSNDMQGALSEYADTSLIAYEDKAFERAMAEKYENKDRC